jgi:carbonic anhydrase
MALTSEPNQETKMENLTHGYAKFREKIFPQHRELFRSLNSGQAPETLMVSCSDSRVDLNFVTQAKPGEIFHVRNAGNLVPLPNGSETAAAGAIEFAVTNLPIRDIVVCGHSDCGAMKGLKAGISEDDNSAVASWLRLAARQTPNASELDLDSLVRANVVHQLDSLENHSFVAERIAKNELQLWGWVYDIGSSQILQLDNYTGEFRALESFETVA